MVSGSIIIHPYMANPFMVCVAALASFQEIISIQEVFAILVVATQAHLQR
jgi:hypothetical protein